MKNAAVALLVVALAGCGSSTNAPASAAPEPAEAAPESAHPLAWMLGSWANEAGDTGESWVAVGDVMVGMGWAVRDGATPHFEVMIIHRLDGPSYFTAMPGGTSRVDFTQTSSGTDEVVFGNPEHDHPKSISYRYAGGDLIARLEGDAGIKQYDMRPAELAPIGTLDGEDRAFDADAAKRGGAAWAERFSDQGALWLSGTGRVASRQFVKVAIGELRREGRVLRWEPSAGAMSPAGDLGFTTGAVRVESEGRTVKTGVYVTVWRRTSEGDWEIAFHASV